ncbi:VOC family protein [Streptomyces sp. NPDC096136]|uniref:VOC family protein n=1 Tax=Streptomyces sp. NPDC096136 TaxID=3366076 RepID=UPI003801EDBA
MVLVPAECAGAPCWISLAARDLAASEAFYRAVFGWAFRRGSFGRAFSVAQADGVAVAGLAEVAGELAVPVAWTPYFAVDDADGAVARIRERGGTVGVGPVAYPPRGRAALATDHEGAAFGIWEGRVLSEWRVGPGTAPAWLELHSRDAFAAALFYGEALQWSTASGRGCCDISYEQDQVVLRYADEAVARLNSGPVEEAAAKPHLRPRWLVHFRVRDLGAAAAAAVAHGGRVVADGPWPAGPGQVTVRDPDGALFTLDHSPAAPWPVPS